MIESAQSQERDIKLDNGVAEKVYLQLDNASYTNDQIIWFKAVVIQALDHLPTGISGLLHVELIDDNKKIVQSKNLKLKYGIAENYFQLSERTKPGKYLIRAYTNWNKNFEENFNYETYVKIFPAFNTDRAETITNVQWIDQGAEGNLLKANLNPLAIDSTDQNRIKVYVRGENFKDSIIVKRDRDDKFLLEYAFRRKPENIALSFITENARSETKEIMTGEEAIDLQFFPESGNMLLGNINRIAFKAIGKTGRGVEVSGEIFDKNDKKITSFVSNKLGMGNISFIPSEESGYYAKITDRAALDSVKYNLPAALKEGYSLTVTGVGPRLWVSSQTNGHVGDSIFVEASKKGEKLFELKGTSNAEGKFGANLPSTNLPNGIIVFKLLDAKRNPVAERLHFHYDKAQLMNIDLTLDASEYGKRDKVKLQLNVPEAKDSLDWVNLSVMVLDESQYKILQEKGENMLSYFLLDSELKGKIEQPLSYFDGTLKGGDLDNLMLTQGWRKYLFPGEILDSITHFPEATLNLSGRVSAAFSSRGKEDIDLTMMTFGKSKGLYMKQTDDNGEFDFLLNDEEGQRVKYVIQSAKGEKKRDFDIDINEYKIPAVDFDYSPNVVVLDTVLQQFVAKKLENRKRVESYNLTEGINELDEVLLESYKDTPGRKKTREEYGEADVVIRGEDIKAAEEDWSYGLYSVLLFNFPDDIRINRETLKVPLGGDEEAQSNLGSYMRAQVGVDSTLVVVDGIPVNEYAMGNIENIPPSEVVSVEIIRFANNFSLLYREVHPQADYMSIPATGNVIAIYTEAGKGLYATEKPKGILQGVLKGIAPAQEFYSPKYETEEERKETKPDYRSLIYWKPIIETKDGTAEVSFYNDDSSGTKYIVVEAISRDGVMGYKVIEYSVD